MARPSDETAVAFASTSAESRGELLMADFSRRCAQLWQALHGRRFCSYKTRETQRNCETSGLVN